MCSRVMVGILCLLAFCSCDEQEKEDCHLDDEGCFELYSPDMEFYSGYSLDPDPTFDATLVEMPHIGKSGGFVLRNEESNDYRFLPLHPMDWEKQLDGLQIGNTYHFVLSASQRNIVGMKIFDDGLLLYLASSCASTFEGGYCAFGYDLEGFSVLQLTSQEPCFPVHFRYGEKQQKTLYQTQEETFTIPQGKYVVHLLHSSFSREQDEEDNSLTYTYYSYYYYSLAYSFYIKRLHE